jgi:hypothetical protein
MSNSLRHYINGVEVSSAVEFGTVTDLTSAAFGGERGGGTVTVTDPTGALDLHGWHPYYVNEPACTAQPRIFTGFIAGKKISRGPEGPRGPGRVWECSLNDLNAVFKLRAIRGTDGKRPSETVEARIAWILAQHALSGLIADTGFVTSTGGQIVDEADYRDQYAENVMDDLTFGYDYFAWWDPAAAAGAGAVSLWYGLRTGSTNASTLSISNVAGDANDTTVFSTGASGKSEDGSVERDPDEVYSGEVIKGVFGETYGQRPATITDFIDRDLVYESSRIGKLTTAQAAIAAFLIAHSVEKDTLTLPVRLPAAKVGLIQAGQRLSVRQEHLPGYETAVYTRVSRMTLSQTELAFYDLVLTCTVASPPSPGGPPVDVFPNPGCATSALVQSAVATGVTGGSVTVGAAPVAGNTLVFTVASRSGPPAAPSGYTAIPQGTEDGWPAGVREMGIWYKTAGAGESATVTITGSDAVVMCLMEFSGTLAYDTSAETRTADPMNTNTAVGAAVTPTAGKLGVIVGVFALGTDIDGLGNMTADAGWTEICDSLSGGQSPRNFTVYRIPASTSGTYTPGGTHSGGDQMVADGHGYGAQTVAFICTGGGAPRPGVWVYGEIPNFTIDGSNKSGTTRFPFADGSLTVRVDGVPILSGLSGLDGATGAFTLDFAPLPASGDTRAEIVTVDYQGR